MGPGGRGVYLDFADSISRLDAIRSVTVIYSRCTKAGENAYQRPMGFTRLFYRLGGLWVDYDLMTTILVVAAKQTFPIHGANRLGASALMQGLSDGYFVIPTQSVIIWPVPVLVP